MGAIVPAVCWVLRVRGTCESYHALDNSIACLCQPAHSRRLQDSRIGLAIDNSPVALSPPRQDFTATSTSGLASKRLSGRLPRNKTQDCPAWRPDSTSKSQHIPRHTVIPIEVGCQTTAHLDVSPLASSECRAPRESWHGWGARRLDVEASAFTLLWFSCSAVFALWTELLW